MKHPFLVLGTLLVGASSAHAFSGEDPVFGHPWYHEKITRLAAKEAGFDTNPDKDARDATGNDGQVTVGEIIGGDPLNGKDDAAEALAWHADYVDSYLYNPIWWGQGGLDRYKASRAMEDELKKLHFDDLFTTDKVNAMWRRYASGTFAGLIWASEQPNGGDVHAAQNLVGVSLHAMQDFYSHSAWIDKPERRTKTYFEYSIAARMADNLYTGAYEKDHQLGVKSHGKWIPKNSVWGQPGVKQIMEVACDPISPFSNSDACAAWKEVKAGTPMQPNVGGVPLPASIMVYTPAGIALDNTWVASEAVKQRGLTAEFPDDAHSKGGKKAFDATYVLALRQSVQWLKTLETAMGTAGKSEFWKRVKTEPANNFQRTAQFEKYNQFPFTFLTAGDYPPTTTGNAEQWFLRVRLQTAKGRTGGTDSDIQLRAGGKVFNLDYLPKTNPILAYNDFEAGDNDVYIVGPFDSCPDSFDLINNAADGRELVQAVGRDFVNGVEQAWQTVGDVLLNVVGGHADKVAVNKQLWMPSDLAAVSSQGTGFNIALNGGKEGNYRANGTIFKVAENETNYEFEVHIDSLSCIKESTWDRLSTEDEPFLLCALNPLPGDQQTWLSSVYQNVDTGETVNVAHGFGRVSIPKSSGMLNLALTLMESDDEKQKDRETLLQKFAGTYQDKTKNAQRTFVEALATTVAAEWKVQHIEVNAWSRNGAIRQGKVFDEEVNRWVKPKVFQSFQLNPAKAVFTKVTTDDLLPYLATPPEDKPDPAEPIPNPEPVPPNPNPVPPVPTNPNQPVPTNPNPVPPIPIPDQPVPGTNIGTSGAFLPLSVFGVRVDNVAFNVEDTDLEVFCTFKNRTSKAQNINGSMIRAVATDADGVGFMDDVAFYNHTGDAVLMAGNHEVAPNGELKARLKIRIPDGTSAMRTLTLWENKSQPQTVNISGVTWPGVKPAANLGAMKLSNGTNEFQACGETLDVRFDGVRKARSGYFEAFFTFKNTSDSLLRDHVLDFNSSALDVFTVGDDGVKQRYDTLMRANGEKAIWIPIHYAIIAGGEARVRYTFVGNNGVPRPVKVTVGDRVSKTTLEWPVSAK